MTEYHHLSEGKPIDDQTAAAARAIARKAEAIDPETPVVAIKPATFTRTGHAIANPAMLAPLWMLYVPHARAAREVFEAMRVAEAIDGEQAAAE